MAGLENTTLNNRYFLRKLAGEGGMGQVYQAWDRNRSVYLAIKIIQDRFFESFVREVVALENLAHPNIVRYYGVEKDEKNRVAFIIMDWVDGKDLQGILKKRYTPMGIGEVGHILGGVTKALHFAHVLGICHCDIKPANMLLRNSDNLPILSDFGLAHATHDLGGGGTLPYMAPELLTGGQVSVASDIYALGITLFQFLSRQLPFQAKTPEQLVQAHLYAPPPSLKRINPSLPQGIVHVIEKALRKDPTKRQESVTQLWEEFSRYTSSWERETPTLTSGLYGLRGEKKHQKINTAGIQVTVGRSKKNHICLKHPSVSRRHASIFWKQGQYYIRDYGSSVGTFINGRKIQPNEPFPLHNKDEIRFGVADVFEFHARKL